MESDIRPMNIAIFASAFYPSFGGVEEFCRQVAHEFVRKGHRVIVLTNRWPRDLPEHEVYEGLDVYRLPFRSPDAGMKSRITYRLTRRRIRARLVDLLRNGIDLLQVHCVSASAHYACWAKRMLGLPLVVTLHGELSMDA
ncbi:MAG: glycosyltransferase family 4 protein, partial [Tepidisphaeraceae bacterium]